MPNALAKLDDLKAALDLSGTDLDALLTRLLEDATATAARRVGLPTLMREADIIEYPEPRRRGSAVVTLSRYPVEAIGTLKLAGYTTDSDGFAAIDSLTDETDFIYGKAFGDIELLYGETFAAYPRANLVVYTAGYIDPADAAPPAGAIQAPADLQRGIVLEATRLYNTRLDAGIDEVDAGKGGSHRPDVSGCHQALAQVCQGLRRVSL
ncbi:MAG: hypothetical protein AAGL98_04105 [Planctomycetota bacterium]